MRTLWTLAAAACCVACVNVVILLLVPSYDLHIGPLHLVAHQLFKPLLIAGFAFWIAVFLRGLMPEPPAARGFPDRPRRALPAIAVAYGAVCILSASINFTDPDWAATAATAGLHGWSGMVSVFASPSPDGFYRPTLLLSLWLDSRLFGSALWAYHLQSILLHALNAALVYRLMREFEFEIDAAFWAAALFLLAAADFEPIMWPAARTDLFATAFVLLSVIWFMRGELWFAAAAYTLGLLSKESAYCVPLLLAAIAFYRHVPRAKLLRPALVLGAITVAMLAVRVAIYGGLGGYPGSIAGGLSPHFALTVHSITGIATRAIPMPLLGLNLSVRPSGTTACFVALYLAAIAWCAWQGAALAKRERLLAGLALLSALPMVNLIGWVGESMKHSRYLYLPGMWMIMAAAAVIARQRFGNLALAALVAANAAGAIHNLNVYRSVLGEAHSLSAQIALDSAVRHAKAVDLTDVEAEPFGVVLFRREIANLAHTGTPGLCISPADGQCASESALKYEWPPR